MAPQLGWIGLGNMGRVRVTFFVPYELQLTGAGDVQEPGREGQAI